MRYGLCWPALLARPVARLPKGRGRDEDCSSPPAQIPACAANAPGSCLGSNVIGLRGMGYPCSSDPWARRFGDMLVPALCPGHASQLTLPSTGRLPSTVSAADVTRHCSRLHGYYAAVQLLTCVHAHRSAVAFMGRSDVPPDTDEVSQVPTKGRLHVHGSSTARGPSSASHLRGEDVAFRPTARRQHPEIRPVSQLNTQPVVSPVNASSWPSRAALASLGAGAAG